MKEKLLTVGIPVYNGERFLKQTLNSIVVALNEKIDFGIEVLISDNCSIDKTEEIIKSYQNKLKISYYKNDKNYGYDRNIDLVVERSKGKYVWFFGCGEIMKSDALKIITNKISLDTYDTILINFDIYSEKDDDITSNKSYQLENNLKINSKDDMFKKYKGAAMAVSGNIILTDAWIQNKIELLETGWCHIERINRIIISKDYNQSLIIPEKCFTLYREKNGWWTTELIYINYIIYCKLLYSLNDDIVKSTFNSIDRKIYPKPLLNSIYVSKTMGIKFNKKIIIDTIKIFYNKVSFWILIFPLLLLPNNVFRNKKIAFLGKKIYNIAKKIINRGKNE